MQAGKFIEQFRPQEPKAWHRLAASLGMFILGTVFASWAARIPDVQANLGLSNAELGYALFATPLGQFIAMMITPSLVRRFSSRRVALTAMLLHPAVLIALGAAGDGRMLFAVLMLFGVCYSLLSISVNTQALQVENLYQRSIMAKVHGCWSMGGVLGGLAGGVMAGLHVPPVWHFTLIFVLAVFCARFCSRHFMQEDLKKPSQGSVRRWQMPDAILLVLGAVGFGSMLVEGAMYNWNSVYFVSVLGEDGFSARSGYLSCMLLMVCARFVADGFINRYGEIPVLRVSALSMAAGLALLVFSPGYTCAVVASGFVGFGMAAVVPICYSMAGRLSTVSPAAAISMVCAISFLGFLMGPPVIGALSDVFTLRGAFVAVLLSPVIIGGLSFVLAGRAADAKRN
mgnify:CR=1 FL=1